MAKKGIEDDATTRPPAEVERSATAVDRGHDSSQLNLGPIRLDRRLGLAKTSAVKVWSVGARLLPRARRQPRLGAGLVEELLAVELVLDGHLRQRAGRGARPVITRPCLPISTSSGARRAHRREHRDLDARLRQLLGAQRLEARIARRRGHRQLLDGEIERRVGVDAADAAAQLAAGVDGDERAARLEQRLAVRRARRHEAGRQVLAQGRARDAQELALVVVVEAVAPPSSRSALIAITGGRVPSCL